MAATTLKSIIDAWKLVLEAAPVSLVVTQQPFSHDREPNATIQDAYFIEDGGPVQRRGCGAYQEVRIDQLIVWVAKPVSFAGLAQFETMEQLADTIYRYLTANGRTNGWNVEAAGRRITHPAASELLIMSCGFTVDYDFNGSTS